MTRPVDRPRYRRPALLTRGLVLLFGGVIVAVLGVVTVVAVGPLQGGLWLVLGATGVGFGVRELVRWANQDEEPARADPGFVAAPLAGPPLVGAYPRGRVRAACFLAGLAVLEAIHALAPTGIAALAALYVLVWAVLPAVWRRWGRAEIEPTGRSAAGVIGLVATAAVPSLALGAGPVSWLWMLAWAVLELSLWGVPRLTRDRVMRPVRPVRGAALTGLATGTVITMLSLLQRAGPGEALATGAACGVAMFFIGLVVA